MSMGTYNQHLLLKQVPLPNSTNKSAQEKTYNIPNMGKSLHLGMPTILVIAKGVEVLLKRLNPKKAVGPDVISIRLL